MVDIRSVMVKFDHLWRSWLNAKRLGGAFAQLTVVTVTEFLVEAMLPARNASNVAFFGHVISRGI
jgi:hypothetical protein